MPNQAGMTLFVDPALVDGTLREGRLRLAELDTAWEPTPDRPAGGCFATCPHERSRLAAVVPSMPD